MFLKCDHLKKLEINRWCNFGLLLAFKIIIIINAVRAAQVEQWLAILPHNKNVLSSILPSSQGFFCVEFVPPIFCICFQPQRSCIQSSRRWNIVQAFSRPSWSASWRDGTDFATNCRRTTTLSQHFFRPCHKNEVRLYTHCFYVIANQAGWHRRCNCVKQQVEVLLAGCTELGRPQNLHHPSRNYMNMSGWKWTQIIFIIIHILSLE